MDKSKLKAIIEAMLFAAGREVKKEESMKVRTKDGKVIPLGSTLTVISGFGRVRWWEIEEFLPEANDIAMGWKGNLKVPRDEKT